jgi:hypothetical protein
MGALPPTGRASWARAAEDLARRVNRRERWSAWLAPCGIPLLLAGATAVALGTAGALPGGVLGVAGLLVLGLAAGALRRVAPRRPVAAGDAAWALDRLAGIGERGLTAAVVHGPAAAEAAFAPPAIPAPPRVRVAPPTGLALPLAGLLLGAGALLVGPEATRGSRPAGPEAPGADAPAAVATAAEREAAAQRHLGAARRDEAVREALGLGPEETLDASEWQRHVADPAVRQRVEEALEAAGADATGADAGSPDPLEGRGLGPPDADYDAAQRARREAALARAHAPRLPIPTARREAVARYLGALAASPDPETPR